MEFSYYDLFFSKISIYSSQFRRLDAFYCINPQFIFHIQWQLNMYEGNARKGEKGNGYNYHLAYILAQYSIELI